MAKTKNVRNIGQKLMQLRKKKGFSLEELSEKTGLKIDYLQSIENSKDLPPVGDILKISRILTVDPNELFQSDEEKQKELYKKRIHDFTVRESSYFYTVLTPSAEDKHLRAFRVIIPSKSEHPRINQHEGEEFVYVLDGTVEVTVGKKKHLLKKDGTLHFDSNIPHSLKNNGRKDTILIVTLYTP